MAVQSRSRPPRAVGQPSYYLCLCLLLSFAPASAQETADAAAGTASTVEEAVQSDDTRVTINTFLGSITGLKVTSAKEKTHFTFKGIPYAKPPVGSLRFQPPVPASAWGGDLEAVDFKPLCAQVPLLTQKFTGSEDCLYLNIYTPSLPARGSASQLKAVMVWFHGGSFVAGSAREYNPSPLVDKDVVVVTVNYRVGALGFMTFGNNLVGGNMGIRDQIEALRWIQRHIRSFGGNPSAVTVFGTSAGAISAHLLHLSPLTAGLLSGAIAHSGTMLMDLRSQAMSREGRIAEAVAQVCNCSAGLDIATLSCLQNVTADQLVTRTTDRSFIDRTFNWWPVMDGAYSANPVLPVEPYTALKSGRFQRRPLLTGTVKNDGALFLLLLTGLDAAAWARAGPLLMQKVASSNATETTAEERMVADIIRKYYTDHSFNLNEGWRDFFTDAIFLSPDQKTAEMTARYNPLTFNYRLNFSDQFSFAKAFGAKDNSQSPVHGDELSYLFSQVSEAFELAPTETEERMAEVMTTYWTNFAKYGDPSPFQNSDLPTWLPYSQNKNYMELKPEPEMKSHVESERMLMWQRVLWDKKNSDYSDFQLYERSANYLFANRFYRTSLY